MTPRPSASPDTAEPFDTEADAAASGRAERRVLWKELAALGVVGVVVVVRQLWLR